MLCDFSILDTFLIILFDWKSWNWFKFTKKEFGHISTVLSHRLPHWLNFFTCATFSVGPDEIRDSWLIQIQSDWIKVFPELRCSAISSPITPSIDINTIPNSTCNASDDFDAPNSHFQPLIQRSSMGNLKWDYPSGRCPSEAPQVVTTGTKGLTFLLNIPCLVSIVCLFLFINAWSRTPANH